MDKPRPSSWREGKTSGQRGYNYKWQKARETYLNRPENVLCKKCLERDRVEPATVVDHVIPHKGDVKLFWDSKNWQPLCKPCHDGAKQAEENGSRRVQIGLDGWPVGK